MSTNKVSALKKKDDDAQLVEENTEAPTVQHKHRDDDEEQSFDINPIKKKCTYCNVEVVTYVEHEGHPLFVLFALVVVMVFGLLSVVILPISYLLTKNAVHRCSRCLQKLGEKQCFGIPTNVQDEIWHFRLGKCSVVLSRGYALILLVIFTALSLYYVYMRPSYFQPISPYEVPKESKVIDTTWQEFLQDCGGEVIVENYVHARTLFNKKYENNQIAWIGYFAEQKQTNAALPFFGSDHALNILVKMSPSESVLYPDLVLSVSSETLRAKKQVIQSLKKGDEIRFEARIMSLGNEFKMHHLHAMDFEKTGKFQELSEIIVRESTLP